MKGRPSTVPRVRGSSPENFLHIAERMSIGGSKHARAHTSARSLGPSVAQPLGLCAAPPDLELWSVPRTAACLPSQTGDWQEKEEEEEEEEEEEGEGKTGVRVGEGQTDRQRSRETERQRDRERQTETDREAERQRGRETERQREGAREAETQRDK